MADKPVTVNPGGGATYSSLNAAFSGEDGAEFDAYTGILYINCSGATDDTTLADTGAGFGSPSATHYIHVVGDSASASLDTSKYLITANSSSAVAVIRNRINYTRFSNLQVFATYTTSENNRCLYSNSEDPITLKNCIFKGNTGSESRGVEIGGGSSTIINCVFYDFANRAFYNESAGSANLYNLTIANCGVGIYRYAGTVTVKNCLFADCTTDASGTITDTYCATTNNNTKGLSSGGTGNRFSQTFSFVGAADFHLASNDAGALGYGTDLSGSGVTTDIDGETRSGTWDIGADEYVASALTLTIAELLHSHSLDSFALPGGAVTLTIAELLHSHALESQALVQRHIAILADLLHGHGIDSAALTQRHKMTVADIAQGQVLDGATILQRHILAAADLAHSHALDAPALSQRHILALQDLLFGHSLDTITLSAKLTLAIQELAHSQALDGVSLSQAHRLAVSDLLHSHGLDALALSLGLTLIINDILHGHTADSPALTQRHSLGVNDLSQGATLDSLSVNQRHIIQIFDLLQAHTTDEAALSVALLLAIADLSQGQALDSVGLSQFHILVVDSLGASQVIDSPTIAQVHSLLTDSLLHGHRLDTITFVSAIGAVTITLSGRSPSVSFEAKKPGITFH
jgi:hypothetical protein